MGLLPTIKRGGVVDVYDIGGVRVGGGGGLVCVELPVYSLYICML